MSKKGVTDKEVHDKAVKLVNEAYNDENMGCLVITTKATTEGLVMACSSRKISTIETALIIKSLLEQQPDCVTFLQAISDNFKEAIDLTEDHEKSKSLAQLPSAPLEDLLLDRLASGENQDDFSNKIS